ncbi:hypothetical protein H5410_021416 [Solanum commersonii]|uniref:rRNA biogenesis protein RRP36 n=1 Tax=Solanum commersonii TaxID=4109 RepID=A0A9J5ZDY2_SOLCO|nr:hypothetical protein H5410_021416 [Solanum commersonii]
MIKNSSKIKFDESDEHESSSEDEEEKGIEEELADRTWSDGSNTVYRTLNSEGKSSRANKNRPMEMSSKKPHKKKEREAPKQGKQPYYLKKSEIQKCKLIEKYKSLKAAGKLESYIEKKRRKNDAKDHRFLPYRCPGEQEN